MILDEAIKHADEVVQEKQYEYQECVAMNDMKGATDCVKCAEEHRQLAEWLKDYKRLLEQQPCEDAISRQAVINKIFNASDNNCDVVLSSELMDRIKALPPVTPQTKWTPVSEGLPESFRFVDCTCHSLIDDRKDWVVETVYIPQPSNSPYSDWGNIPMLNHKECEVIAWVYREIPEPYKGE